MNQFQIIGWVQIIKDSAKLMLMHIVYRTGFLLKETRETLLKFLEKVLSRTFLYIYHQVLQKALVLKTIFLQICCKVPRTAPPHGKFPWELPSSKFPPSIFLIIQL